MFVCTSCRTTGNKIDGDYAVEQNKQHVKGVMIIDGLELNCIIQVRAWACSALLCQALVELELANGTKYKITSALFGTLLRGTKIDKC